MDLDHERLDVYHLALDFLVVANGIIEGLPRGRGHLADQFTRASTSIARDGKVSRSFSGTGTGTGTRTGRKQLSRTRPGWF
jgi:hypothetical protein